MKYFYFILLLFLSVGSYAQVQEKEKVEKKATPLQGEVVPTEKRTTTTETTATDPNGQTRYYVISRDNPETREITKEEKIAEIEQKIQSVEGKLFLLNEDPVANETEIGEKLAYLQELNSELETLKK